MNFEIIKGGPVVPKGVNEKSFLTKKIAAGESMKFKDGDVLKITGGKVRLRSDEEKNFTDANSAYAEKGDIVNINGPVFAANQEKEDHVAMRVFTSNKVSIIAKQNAAQKSS